MGHKISLEEFKKRGNEKHGNFFIYDKVKFDTLDDKVTIICPIHGEFTQIASNHLRGRGCKKCYQEKRADSQQEFITKANNVHNFFYDYNKTVYKNSRTKILVTCPIHGDFWQLPVNHLSGRGCPKCARDKEKKRRKKGGKQFAKEANIIHEGKYKYDENTYINNYTKTKITCPIHGDFWQTPKNHLRGAGCPICNSSKLEKKMRNFLNKKGEKFIEQKKFIWLRDNKPLRLDFYLPKYNIAIECQGLQHFKIALDTNKRWFNGESDKLIIQKYIEKIELRDKIKHDLCEKHEIKIFYFTNIQGDLNYHYPIYTDLETLLNDIISQSNKTF